VIGIVIFAMVALFLGLRLYAVLGRRTGHEQSSVPVVEDIVKTVPPVIVNTGNASPAKEDMVFDAAVASGLKAIHSADSGFDPVRFIDGARSAYKMIIEAFWKGDETELATLANDDVRASFGEAIAARTEAGHVLDNRLIQIEKSAIVKAWVENKVAHITVQFVADIAAVTRDKDGKVVAGSLTDAVPTTDVWTFSRPLRSGTSEWTLTDTDESA
jgi:predicted lipid-binding transport protein (Tim44 family)